jgi:hypothetical protein
VVFVAVFVFVFVVAPGDVAALGSGNAAGAPGKAWERRKFGY